MGRVIAAEWLKLRKRPAIWISIAILVAVIILLGYVLSYLIFTYTKPPTGPPGQRAIDYALLKQALYPLHFHQQILGNGAQLGGILALIIGVLAQGSEYGWGTVKTVLTQRPRRWEVIAGRLVTLTLIALLITILQLALGAVTSWLMATVDGRSGAFPDPTTILKAGLALWLITCFWTYFGFFLATLFQQSALAIGLGLAYALVVEALIFGLGDQFGGDAIRQIHQWFPIQNTSFLVQAFGRASAAPSPGGPSAKPFADATHAVVMLLVYCGALVGLTQLLTTRRDVL